MLSTQNASDEEYPQIMKPIPNKVGYKWIKNYDIMTVKTSNILIFNQADDDALDNCQKVVKYSSFFNVLQDIHEVEMGNDHPKAKTIYKSVCSRYWRSIPCSVCELFPLFCPVCIRANMRKKPQAGHQLLPTKGMNVQADRSYWLSEYARWPVQLCVRLPRSWHKILPIMGLDTEDTQSSGYWAHPNILSLWTTFHPSSGQWNGVFSWGI